LTGIKPRNNIIVTGEKHAKKSVLQFSLQY